MTKFRQGARERERREAGVCSGLPEWFQPLFDIFLPSSWWNTRTLYSGLDNGHGSMVEEEARKKV